MNPREHFDLGVIAACVVVCACGLLALLARGAP